MQKKLFNKFKDLENKLDRRIISTCFDGIIKVHDED